VDNINKLNLDITLNMFLSFKMDFFELPALVEKANNWKYSSTVSAKKFFSVSMSDMHLTHVAKHSLQKNNLVLACLMQWHVWQIVATFLQQKNKFLGHTWCDPCLAFDSCCSVPEWRVASALNNWTVSKAYEKFRILNMEKSWFLIWKTDWELSRKYHNSILNKPLFLAME
jgi:hypothetical protein